jgi:hypothetical protein
MPLVKSHRRFGKKQTATLRDRSASTRNAASGKKSKSGDKPTKKSGSRNSRSAARFSSLKSRQMTVESAKRSVWAAVQKITSALIGAAGTGNLATAKELFHFAGVYSLPAPEDESAVVAAAPVPASQATAPAAEPAMVHPIDLFFKKIGVEPSTADPEPEAA